MARAALPDEACGLVAAHRPADWTDRSPIVVSRAVPVVNSAARPDAFALDGASMIEAESAIDRNGEVVVGVFHSHPTGEAKPSTRDVTDAQRYDPVHELVQLIVSLQGFAPGLRAWRYGDTAEESVELRLVTR